MIAALMLRWFGPADVAELAAEGRRQQAQLSELRGLVAGLRADLAEAQAELARTRQQLAEAQADGRVASRENEGCWRLVELYRAEVDKFTAISQRDAASALGIRAMIAAGDEEE